MITGKFVLQTGNVLHDLAPERDAHLRLQTPAGPGFAVPALQVSRLIVRMFFTGTRSASRPCSTRTTTLIGSSFGTRSSTSFGAVFARALSSCCTSSWPEKLVRMGLD